jgi:hypothetical protein
MLLIKMHRMPRFFFKAQRSGQATPPLMSINPPQAHF